MSCHRVLCPMAGSANNSDIIIIFSRRTSLLGTPSFFSATHLQHPRRQLPMDRSHLLRRRHRHSPRTQRRKLAPHGTFPLGDVIAITAAGLVYPGILDNIYIYIYIIYYLVSLVYLIVSLCYMCTRHCRARDDSATRPPLWPSLTHSAASVYPSTSKQFCAVDARIGGESSGRVGARALASHTNPSTHHQRVVSRSRAARRSHTRYPMGFA